MSLGGLLAAQVVQRRAPVKAVFNLGMYAIALAPAIVLYQLVLGDAAMLSARGMVAMAAGGGRVHPGQPAAHQPAAGRPGGPAGVGGRPGGVQSSPP